ncbi:MAG: GH25 family lysozyme [Oscillospiraceae bacterium]
MNLKRMKKPALGIKGMLSIALCATTFAALLTSTYLFGAQAETVGLDTTVQAGAKSYTSLASARRMSYESVGKKVLLSAASVELDLGVTVYAEDKITAINGVPFEFEIKGPDGKVEKVKDDNLDGQIYIDGLKPGEYGVSMLEVAGINTPAPITVIVNDKIAYVKVDVSDKIKTEDEVNVEEEDKQFGGGGSGGGGSTPTPNPDTVEYVATSQKSETKTTVTPIVNEKGEQVFKYKPTLSAKGFLMKADKTESDIIAVVDENGYITGAKRLAPTTPPTNPAVPPSPPATSPGTTTPPAATPPTTPAPAAPPAEPVYNDVTGEVLGANGAPLADANGVYLFQMQKIALEETKTETVITYFGWQTLDGKVYYFDKNGVKVTGKQVIQGITYSFDSNGVKNSGTTLGIDVSTWQDSINWTSVKASGIDFAIIRVGYRGYTKGSLVEDSMFRRNMSGAAAAGIKLGVYFFTQAINEVEAVEEASMCIQLCQGYSLTYPIFIDIEYSGSSQGRANNLTNEQRTKIAIAFCETVRSAGYKAGVYANKNYFESKLYTAQLANYVIWLAHYTSAPQSSYAGRYDMWQYSSTGTVPGVNGNVDMNISYVAY